MWLTLSGSQYFWARTNKVGKVILKMKRGRQGFLQDRVYYCFNLNCLGNTMCIIWYYLVKFSDMNKKYIDCTFSWYVRLRTGTVVGLKPWSVLSHGAQYTLLWTCLNSRCRILSRSYSVYMWPSYAWLNLKGGTGSFGVCKWLTTVSALHWIPSSLKPGMFGFTYTNMWLYIVYIYSLHKLMYLYIQL